jgi:hypothetical protein
VFSFYVSFAVIFFPLFFSLQTRTISFNRGTGTARKEKEKKKKKKNYKGCAFVKVNRKGVVLVSECHEKGRGKKRIGVMKTTRGVSLS